MTNGELKLTVSKSSGHIYLSINSDRSKASNINSIITEKCITATAEWFMSNGKKRISANETIRNQNPTLFFCSDPKKIEQIWAILKED